MTEFFNTTSGNPDSDENFLPWNNPANIISYDVYLEMAFYFQTVMKPSVVSIGLVTNIINCLVFRRQGLGDRMNLCLYVLALVDTVYLAHTMMFTVAYWVRIQHPLLGDELYQKLRGYTMGVNYGFREASACISVVIAVERCVCVVFPLRANKLMSTRTMGILLVTIVIGMQLAFLTTPFKKYVFSVTNNVTGEISWTLGLSHAWQKNENLLLYDKVEDTIMLVMFPFLTFILVSCATAITVMRLRAAMSWREKMSSFKGNNLCQQVALTKMLIASSIAFVICKIPMISISLVRIFNPEFSPFGSQSNVYKVAELMAHYFPYAHSAFTFFIYYSQSLKFKTVLASVCACHIKTNGLVRKRVIAPSGRRPETHHQSNPPG